MHNIIRKIAGMNYYVMLLVLIFIIGNLRESYFFFTSTEIALFTFLALLAVFLLYRTLVYLTKRRNKAALIFAVVFVPMANFTFIHSILFTNTTLSEVIFKPNLVLTIFLTLASSISIYFIFRTKYSLQNIKKILNLFSLILFLLSASGFIYSYDKNPLENAMPSRPDFTRIDSSMLTMKKGANRDIYLLVFDSYTSFESLKKYWNFSNSDMGKELDTLNFKTAGNGRSNYNYTTISIASLLNLSYFDSTKVRNQCERTIPLSFLLIKENLATRILISAGYTFYNVTPFDIQDQDKSYDPDFFSNEPDNIFHFFIDKTVIGVLYDRITLKKMDEINLAAFDKLKQIIIDSKSPRFVYAHFMIPHDPFFFYRNGSRIPEPERNGSQAKRKKWNYLEQLMYSNSKIKELLELIFSQSKRDPIVIVLGDHGYRFLDNATDRKNENHSILFSVHMPDIQGAEKTEDITGVNLFRSLFNNYFGFAFPLLEHEEEYVPAVED